ncbi:hypothetical protein LSH36_593g01031 [Paralvinella palmiformis]|uniref:Uncharacterized protein n=1 Tax=Paralvinella palmiformis TaxID=53620 RepID=A0AAD9J4V1_9ANNE|nr:hypothetical protein LSH36_593g01031 [Paralvinella palmiformis]
MDDRLLDGGGATNCIVHDPLVVIVLGEFLFWYPSSVGSASSSALVVLHRMALADDLHNISALIYVVPMPVIIHGRTFGDKFVLLNVGHFSFRIVSAGYLIPNSIRRSDLEPEIQQASTDDTLYYNKGL